MQNTEHTSINMPSPFSVVYKLSFYYKQKTSSVRVSKVQNYRLEIQP